MLIKKPAIVLSSYNALCVQYPTQPLSKPKTSCTRSHHQPLRTYATIKDSPPKTHNRDNEEATVAEDLWPKAIPPHRIPTPYQILSLHRGDPYTKTDRFYNLVKLYHPDRHEHPHSLSHAHLSPSDRLERYRLIISAHAILSDPHKRSAYDLYGAGWASTSATSNTAPSFTYSQEARKAAMGNATWEDWEDWYSRFRTSDDPPRQPQTPIYLSNSAFISLIAILAALGGVGQATRASEASHSFLAQRDELHEKAVKELARVKKRSEGWSRDERIDMFLRDRDPEAYKDKGLRRVLLETDVCGVEEKGRGGRDNDFRRKYG